MIKVICDKCGKEPNYNFLSQSKRIGSCKIEMNESNGDKSRTLRSFDFDLCETCTTQLLKVIDDWFVPDIPEDTCEPVPILANADCNFTQQELETEAAITQVT